MKKLICLLLVVVMTCTVLSGCEWEKVLGLPGDQTVDELIAEMKWDYLSEYNITNVSPDDVFVEHFAGIYNGYLVAMVDATRHVYEKAIVNIGGVDFTYFDGNRLIAYKNGEFLSLEDAFNQGVLSKEDLVEIEANFSTEKTSYYDFCDIHDNPITGLQGTPYFGTNERDKTFDRLNMVLYYGGELPPMSLYNTGNPDHPIVVEVIDKSSSEFHDYYKGKLYFVELIFDRAYSAYELLPYVTVLHNKPWVVYVDSIWHPMSDSISFASTVEYENQWGVYKILYPYICNN